MTPEEFNRDLAQGALAPVYYLYGEPYQVERAGKRLLDLAVPPEWRDFNLEVFYGKECRGMALVEAAQTLPMFAERRVVVVKGADGLAAEIQEELVRYLERPSPSTCLVLLGEKADKRRKLAPACGRQGGLVEFKPLYENQLPAFVREEAAARGKKLAGEALEALVLLAGPQLQELVSQLEKLVTYVGERQNISLADVQAVVSASRVDDVFALGDALGRRQLPRALQILDRLLVDGEAPVYLLSMVVRQFRIIWQVQALQAAKRGNDAIAKELRISPYFLRGYLEQARNFRDAELATLYREFLVVDRALKSQPTPPRLLLEQLCYRICRP